LTLADTVEDPAAAEAMERVDGAVYNAELRAALDNAMARLAAPQRETIEAHYYHGQPFKAIAASREAPLWTIRQEVESGFRRLQQTRSGLEPYALDIMAYRHRGLSAFNTTFTSDVEAAVMKLA
jgi:DNA-directed RNA polymerase specialized sigma24 family protein